jgi:hydroxypyruvate isomerase
MPRFCANLAMLCTEHAFLDRFAAAPFGASGTTSLLNIVRV